MQDWLRKRKHADCAWEADDHARTQTKAAVIGNFFKVFDSIACSDCRYQAHDDRLRQHLRHADQRIAVAAQKPPQMPGFLQRPAGCLQSAHHNCAVDGGHQRHDRRPDGDRDRNDQDTLDDALRTFDLRFGTVSADPRLDRRKIQKINDHDNRQPRCCTRRTAESRTGADSLIAARDQIVRKRQTDDDTEELLCKL